MRWGELPQVQIPAGPVLKLNTTGDRVALLRQRLGLAEGTKFDAATAAAVKEFQGVHGIKADGVAGAGTIDALNRGFKHYENVLMLNLERAKRLPITTEAGRYVLVDAGAARLWMFENGRAVDSMRVIVGEKATGDADDGRTAALRQREPLLEHAARLRAEEGRSACRRGGSQIPPGPRLSGAVRLVDDATPIDAATVDWQAVADGKSNVRLRRGPGAVEFDGRHEVHDAQRLRHLPPRRARRVERRRSRRTTAGSATAASGWRMRTASPSGCSAVVPKGQDPKVEENVDLPEPVPVYVTYLTAEGGSRRAEVPCRPLQPRSRLLARYFGDGQQQVAAVTP